MTAANPERAKPQYQEQYVLPDIPEREPDDMTSFQHLGDNGNAHHLAQHLGNRGTTLVSGERYITRSPGSDMRYPDLIVVFDCDPAAYRRSNGYIISQQSKPPDWVLEIASRSTGTEDTTGKRDWYAALGIPEYWRFDETGEFHGTRLAGDRLVNGRYEPISIETLEDGSLQGFSAVLNLYVRWEQGELRWYDGAAGSPIATFEQEREGRLRAEEARIEELERRLRAEQARNQEQAGRLRAEEARNQEQEGRLRAEEARNQEREARIAAETRVRELEIELQRRQGS